MTRLDLAATAFPRRPRRWIQADAFLQQWPQWHGQIRDALASEDADALEVAAHALKGSARSIAAGAVSETAVELEDAARDRRLADARRAWQRLRPEMVELRRALARRVGGPAVLATPPGGSRAWQRSSP